MRLTLPLYKALKHLKPSSSSINKSFDKYARYSPSSLSLAEMSIFGKFSNAKFPYAHYYHLSNVQTLGKK